MTHLDALLRDCLNERAELSRPTNLVPAALTRSRRLARRRRALAVSGVLPLVAAGAGVGVVASHTSTRVAVLQATPAASTTPTASPPATTDAPDCPSGQVPNLTVDESQPPQPLRPFASGQASPGDSVAWIIAAKDSTFMINRQTPPTGTLWITGHDGNGRYYEAVSDSADGVADAENVKGWAATFSGCEAALS